jgi:hypothetical protein
MPANLPLKVLAFAVVLAAAGGCGGDPPAEEQPKESAVRTDLTQKQATAGVLDFVREVGTQLPAGARLAPGGLDGSGIGTLNCHTDDGRTRTGQLFVRADYTVEDLDPARYPTMVDTLRETWTGLGYEVLEDTHGAEGDLIVAVATPEDDYHLRIWVYGDNRATPQLLVESPCSWPS